MALAGDVGADALPVGRESSGSIVANPSLQIRPKGRTRRQDGLGRREPEEIAIRYGHFGTKEHVIALKDKGRGERDVELDFLAGQGAFTTGELVGERVDAVDHRIEGGEGGV